MSNATLRVVAGASALVALALAVAPTSSAQADIKGNSNSQGITIQTDPNLRLDSAATKQVFCDMKTRGANTVVLQFPLQQDGVHATEIKRRPWHEYGSYTPSDSELVWAIRHAKQCGLDVTLKPTPELPVSKAHPRGEWRSHITFSNSQDALAKAWFVSWEHWTDYYAKIAKAEGVKTLVVGTELVGMTANKCYTDPDIPKGYWSCNKNNSKRWVALIQSARRIDPNLKLTYAAYRGSWNRPKESISLPTDMVKQLDYIGTTFYPGSYSQMKKDKKTYFDPMWSRYKKPIVIEETGFTTENGEAKQAQNVHDLLRFAESLDHVKGLWYFRWANSRATSNQFTTQGRAADDELASYFGGKN